MMILENFESKVIDSPDGNFTGKVTDWVMTEFEVPSNNLRSIGGTDNVGRS